MADSNKIYLAELSTNTTYDISLRVGYFGEWTRGQIILH